MDSCWQEKGVPHVRTYDDRHTGLPRPLPQLRRPPGLLRRPVVDPRTCAARRSNAVHGGVSAASRGGTLLHAPAGCNPPLGSAVTGTPSIPIACRGTTTALSGVASVDGAISHTQAPPPILPKIRKVRRLRPSGYVIRRPIYSGGPPFSYSVDASDLHQKTSESTTPYPAAMPFTSHRSFGPMHPDGPPYPGASHARQQLPHTSTFQCGSSHTFAPFLHTIRRLPHRPTPRRNSPYKCQYTVQSARLLGFSGIKTAKTPRRLNRVPKQLPYNRMWYR